MKFAYRIHNFFYNRSRYLLYLLVFIPFITEYFEDERFEFELHSFITETIISLFIIAVIFIIIRQYNRLEMLSLTDHLTGISNRRQFEIDLRRELFRARRLKLKIVLIFFDLDGFKMINDTYGHKTGDMVLVTFAGCLSRFTRKGIDFCYRFGGDEFAVLLTNISVEDEAGIDERIEHNFSEIISGELPDGVSASRGVVVLQDNETYEDLLARADRAMYNEKMKRKR